LQQNQWVDKNNNIYFIFSNKNLCEYLGYAEQKIIKLKKELINFNLLTQERVGLNKPNRLYLLKPNYDIEASRTKELPNSQSNDTDLNNTDYIKTKHNDTNDLHDTYNKFPINNDHSNHPNQFLNNFENQDDKEILLQEFPEQLTNYLLNYSYTDLEIIKVLFLKLKNHLIQNMMIHTTC
jgi:hypothetical protein